MYRVSTHGVDERMIHVYYYYYFVGGGGGEAFLLIFCVS